LLLVLLLLLCQSLLRLLLLQPCLSLLLLLRLHHGDLLG
jgi:hypothetical protein